MIPPLYWKVSLWSCPGRRSLNRILEALVGGSAVLLEALDDRPGRELDLVEDRRVRPEADARPRPAARRGAGHMELAPDLAPVVELHHVVVALPVHLQDHLAGQSVDHADPNAVEPAGHLVATSAELGPGVEHGHGDFGPGLVLVLVVRVDGEAAAVVVDSDSAVGEDRDVDTGTEPGHRLVYGVVDDLIDKVVQTAQASRPDVHARPLAHGIKSFEDHDLRGIVRV